MRDNHLFFIIYYLSFLSVTACSSDQEETEDAFPSLITEMALIEVGETTSNITMYTDSGKKYRVAGELEGLKPRTWGRGLFGYVLQDASTVEVRTLLNVPLLPNSSELSPLKRDPVDVVSAWMGGGFVNIHLKKKTKGGDHTWGFLGAQVFGALVVGAWAAGIGYIIFKAIDKIHGLRVPARIEDEGLDIYEHGETAYGDA